MDDINSYLDELTEQKNQLAINLSSMKVDCDTSEKLNTLVPKVLDIEKNTMVWVDDTKYTVDNLSLSTVNLTDVQMGDINIKFKKSWSSVSTLPFSFSGGSAVVYGGCIHIFSGTVHYKWNGSSWAEVSTLPYNFSSGSSSGSVVLYNSAIHILGSGNSSYYKYHYKWDGSSWTQVSTLPFSLHNKGAVVYGRCIHIFSGTVHYKWNGSSWTKMNELECSFSAGGSAVVYNNIIYLLSENSDGYNYQCIDSSDYVSIIYGNSGGGTSNTSYIYSGMCTVVYNNEIHTMRESHYTRNPFSPKSVGSLPFNFSNGSAVVYNNEIHILGGSNAGYEHYKWSNTRWTYASSPSWFTGSVYDCGGTYYGIKNSKLCKLVNGSWVELSGLPYSSGGSYKYTLYSVIVVNNEVNVIGQAYRYSTSATYNERHSWNGSGWVEHGFPCEPQGASFVEYNNELHVFRGTKHYSPDGTITLPVGHSTFYGGSVVVYGDKIHLFTSENITTSSDLYQRFEHSHYVYDGSYWSSSSSPPFGAFESVVGSTIVYNDKIHMFCTKNNSHYTYGSNGWTRVIGLPRGYTTSFVYNNNLYILCNGTRYKYIDDPTASEAIKYAVSNIPNSSGTIYAETK